MRTWPAVSVLAFVACTSPKPADTVADTVDDTVADTVNDTVDSDTPDSDTIADTVDSDTPDSDADPAADTDGGADSDSDAAALPAEVEVTVGPGGGTVAVDGATVAFPPGTLPTDTTITIAPAAPGTFTEPQDFPEAVTPVFAFGPSGLEMPQGAEVTFDLGTYDPSATPQDFTVLWSADGVGWDRIMPLSLTEDAGHAILRARVSHFSFGVVVRRTGPRWDTSAWTDAYDALISCDDGVGFTLQLRTNQWGYTPRLYLADTRFAGYWTEEHTLASVDAAPDGSYEIFERSLLNGSAVGGQTADVSTWFDCRNFVSGGSDQSVTVVAAVYDAAGVQSDCVAFGHAAAGVGLGLLPGAPPSFDTNGCRDANPLPPAP